MIASYLGYEDLGKFRRLQFSFPVLEIFQVYFTHCSGAKSSKIPLELLRDLPDLERKLPEDLDEAVHKYTALPESSDPGSKKIETATNLNYLMATLLYRLAGRLESPRDYTAAEIDTRQAAAVSNFLQATKITLPNNVNVSSLVFPSLGPHIDLGEDVLEKYNRVYNLLRSIVLSLAPIRFKKRFGKADVDPFQSTLIHSTSKPHWMVPTQAPTDLGRKLRAPRLPPKSVTLSWDRLKRTKHTSGLEAHIKDFIGLEELQLPKSHEPCKKDPRLFPTGEMWRDTVRRQLRLQQLRLAIANMVVSSPDQSGAMQTCLVFGHGDPALWDDVKALLNLTTQEATFAYTLRALTEEEDFEFEHLGPPLALAAELCLGADNDVELHPQEELRQRSVSAVAEDPAHTTVDMDLEEEVLTFLSGGGGNPLDRKPAVPQSEFLSQDRDRMLEQHDGHDVFTPEGLRDWQIKAMSAAAGTQPLLGLDLGFKDNKAVTAAQRKELLQHRQEGEQTALSIDVRIPVVLSDRSQVDTPYRQKIWPRRDATMISKQRSQDRRPRWAHWWIHAKSR